MEKEVVWAGLRACVYSSSCGGVGWAGLRAFV